MVYTLTKMSSPGWELFSTHIEQIHTALLGCVCSSCIEDDTFPTEAEYNAMSVEDQILELLGTSCGAEFEYETFESFNKYFINALELLGDE